MVSELGAWSKVDVVYNLCNDFQHGLDSSTWYNRGQVQPATIVRIDMAGMSPHIP